MSKPISNQTVDVKLLKNCSPSKAHSNASIAKDLLWENVRTLFYADDTAMNVLNKNEDDRHLDND